MKDLRENAKGHWRADFGERHHGRNLTVVFKYLKGHHRGGGEESWFFLVKQTRCKVVGLNCSRTDFEHISGKRKEKI